MIDTTFDCGVCRQTITQSHHEITTGYGVDDKGNKVCYTCCAEDDKRRMLEHGRIALYFANDGKVTNWPGSLVFQITRVVKSWHNIGRTRFDFWFVGPDRHVWHGYQIGYYNQIAHCNRTKQTV